MAADAGKDDFGRILQPRRLLLQPCGAEKQHRHAEAPGGFKNSRLLCPAVDRGDGREIARREASQPQGLGRKRQNFIRRRPALAAEAEDMAA